MHLKGPVASALNSKMFLKLSFRKADDDNCSISYNLSEMVSWAISEFIALAHLMFTRRCVFQRPGFQSEVIRELCAVNIYFSM